MEKITITIPIYKEYLPFIQANLPEDEIEISEHEKKEFSKVTFKDVDSVCLIRIFHSGIKCGISVYSETKKI
jgi:hypothetical protein